MHLGKRYNFASYLVWTKWEIAYLFLWSVFVTSLFEFLHWSFLVIPEALLAVVGTALAIVLAFKNEECHSRVREALVIWAHIDSTSMIWANKLTATLGNLKALDSADAAARIKDLFYRHFAWLTVLRFNLRETKTWENIHERGNAKFLADLPTPESRTTLKDELSAYFSESELQKIIAYRGNKATRILGSQYRALGELHGKGVLAVNLFISLAGVLDDLGQYQGDAKRMKNYPYARNYYSIAVILVKAFVAILPFAFYPFALEAGKSAGVEHVTAWMNVAFSVLVGWIFVTLEKVGENSSNPFEGGPNDVPISHFARQIEIEMRIMLGEQTDLKPIAPKYDILF